MNNMMLHHITRQDNKVNFLDLRKGKIDYSTARLNWATALFFLLIVIVFVYAK